MHFLFGMPIIFKQPNRGEYAFMILGGEFGSGNAMDLVEVYDINTGFVKNLPKLLEAR